MGYMMILSILVVIMGPALIMNYVKTQVKNGEWLAHEAVIIENEFEKPTI